MQGSMTRGELRQLAEQIEVAAGLSANAVSLKQLAGRKLVAGLCGAEFGGSLDTATASGHREINWRMGSPHPLVDSLQAHRR